MINSNEILILKSAPHLSSPLTTDKVMRTVFHALAAVGVAAVATQGISMLLTLLFATGAAVLTEHLCSRIAGMPSRISDYHAAGTGLLLGLLLPASMPLWMTLAGTVIAVCAGKVLFGGLGSSLFNPSATGRAFLQVCFPGAVSAGLSLPGLDRFMGIEPSTFTFPFLKPAAFLDISDTGNFFMPIVILAAGIWLFRKGVLKWRVSVPLFIAATLPATVFHAVSPDRIVSPMIFLSSSAFWLAVVFLAPEMTTSPTTRLGMWLYGFVIGATGALLCWTTGIAEGLVCAVLLGNALVPLIEFASQPRIYGGRRFWKVETS